MSVRTERDGLGPLQRPSARKRASPARSSAVNNKSRRLGASCGQHLRGRWHHIPKRNGESREASHHDFVFRHSDRRCDGEPRFECGRYELSATVDPGAPKRKHRERLSCLNRSVR